MKHGIERLFLASSWHIYVELNTDNFIIAAGRNVSSPGRSETRGVTLRKRLIKIGRGILETERDSRAVSGFSSLLACAKANGKPAATFVKHAI